MKRQPLVLTIVHKEQTDRMSMGSCLRPVIANNL